jgi:outer membrane protein assembly factor BamB
MRNRLLALSVGLFICGCQTQTPEVEGVAESNDTITSTVSAPDDQPTEDGPTATPDVPTKSGDDTPPTEATTTTDTEDTAAPLLGAKPTTPLGSEEPQLNSQPFSHWTQRAFESETPKQRTETVTALAIGAQHERVWVRVTSADALGTIGPPAVAATDALIDNFESDEPWVRTSSIDALTAMGAAPVPNLIDSFTKGTGRRRFLSALCLAAIGPQAEGALPVLEEALQTEEGVLRDRLSGIIAKIGAKPPASGTMPAAPPVDLTTIPQEKSPPAADKTGNWPQFRGPNRDAKCAETGLLNEWPEEGPPLLWMLDGLGKGYSTVSIAGGKLFTMGDLPDDEGEGAQFVLAFDLESRDPLWVAHVGLPHHDGPRCTPTVDGDRLYALGTDGDLVCVSVSDGEIVWKKNLVMEFEGQMMSGWKFSESPLVDGDRLVCTPGGKEHMMVALDKATGDLIWSCAMPEIGDNGKDGAGYASIIKTEIAGVTQYLQMVGRGLIGVEAESGKFLWGYNRIANKVANIPMPVVRGDYVFCTTSYKSGSALLHIARDGDDWKAEEVYILGPRDFENHHGGVILLGDCVYGGNGQNKGQPTCLKISSGEILWKPRRAPSYGSAAVLYADGHFIFRYDRGPVALIEATPDEYRLKSVFTPVQGSGPAWAHPVIHEGKLYLRHEALLACYDLRAK